MYANCCGLFVGSCLYLTLCDWSPSCFDPDLLLLAYLWLGLSWIGCISTIKHFPHKKQAAGTLHQQQAAGEAQQTHSVEITIKPSGVNGSTKNTGQFAWTPREQETYAIVCCLLKFQSWIGGSAVEIQTDHSAIVKWYKEDLCTGSGPLGRRGRRHEFLSSFNLIITYRPVEENQVADALSRFAYPAGEAQDTNFPVGDYDLAGWEEAE